MSSTESPVIRFLYNTRLGRLMLKALVRPQFSKIAYAYLSSPLSWWLINYYIRKHDINMSEYPFSQGTVRKFTEKGYFEFGGSTILLLIEKDRLLLADEIKSAKNHEIPVRSGQILGKKA